METPNKSALPLGEGEKQTYSAHPYSFSRIIFFAGGSFRALRLRLIVPVVR
jgi:hypothetical protein